MTINSQILKLRNKKGITQEELASVLGVTNQSVSKWELGICCPDIQLIPKLAEFFGVTSDELLGIESVKPNSMDIVTMIKIVRKALIAIPDNERYDYAFKLAAVLHEGIVSNGYKAMPFGNMTELSGSNEKSYYKGLGSVCSEPDGDTAYFDSSVFISDRKYREKASEAVVQNIYSLLRKLSINCNTVTVLFALYELTADDFNLYVSLEEICQKCSLAETNTEECLNMLPIQIKDIENGKKGYRINGAHMILPPLLMMIGRSYY